MNATESRLGGGTTAVRARSLRERLGLLIPIGDAELPAFRLLDGVDRAALVRFGVFVVILLTGVFYAPSLVGGYMADDHFHVLALDEFTEAFTRRLNLFGLVQSHGEVIATKRAGLLPWWTSDEFRINFFRPLPSITHWLDYRLFGPNAAAAHLVSIAWYLGAVYVVYRVLTRFLSEQSRVLLLAVAIFAFDDAHALNVAWIANRNESVGGVFVMAAVLCWLRLREGKGWWHAPLVAFCFALALLSKESTIVLPLLLLSHAVVFPEKEGQSLVARVRARLPLHLVLFGMAAAFAGIYFLLGHGANSIYYIHPLKNPGLWATQFVRSGFFHAVILATGVPLHVLSSSPVQDYPLAALGLGGLTVGFWLLAWKWLRADRGFRLSVIWMVIGQMILTTSFPDPRNLFLPSIAFAYVVARVMQEAWSRRHNWRPGRAIVVVLAGLHLLFAPVLDQVCVAVVSGFQGRYRQLRDGVAAVVDFQHLGPQETKVFFLNWHQREMSAVYGLYLRKALPTGVTDYTPWTQSKTMTYEQKLAGGLGAERIHYYSLSLLQVPFECVKVNDHELVISPKEGHFFSTLFEQLYTTGARYQVGQVFDNGSFKATIELVTPANEVKRVRFTFPEPLSSPGYRFLTWDGARFVPAKL